MSERLLAPRWDQRLRQDIARREADIVLQEHSRIAILSDSHGNLSALQAIVDDIQGQQVDLVLAAGDMAQGGCRPDRVVDVLTERRWPAVIGNSDALLLDVHDALITLPPDLEHFAVSARWSLRQLGAERIAYLRSLPAALCIGLPGERDLLLIHATTWSLEDFVAPDADDAPRRRMLGDGRADVVIHGHIHSPYHRVLPEGVIISVGAVSGSNDQDPRPAYTVLEVSPQGLALEVRRVEADVEAELDAIRRSQIPNQERVLRIVSQPGPWPVRSASAPGTTTHLPWVPRAGRQ